MLLRHPKMWVTIILLVLLLGCMFIIIKHHNNADHELQQKFFDRSEIKDSI